MKLKRQKNEELQDKLLLRFKRFGEKQKKIEEMKAALSPQGSIKVEKPVLENKNLEKRRKEIIQKMSELENPDDPRMRQYQDALEELLQEGEGKAIHIYDGPRTIKSEPSAEEEYRKAA